MMQVETAPKIVLVCVHVYMCVCVHVCACAKRARVCARVARSTRVFVHVCVRTPTANTHSSINRRTCCIQFEPQKIASAAIFLAQVYLEQVPWMEMGGVCLNVCV